MDVKAKIDQLETIARLKAVAAYNAAEDYVAAAQDWDQPCEYGHFGCAKIEGGRCSDEVMHAATDALHRVGLYPQDL